MSEFVVANGWGNTFEVLPVLKRSDKQVTAADKHGRDRRFLDGDVIAVLPEDKAKWLHERLVSSANLARHEVTSANQRHRNRVAELKAEVTK